MAFCINCGAQMADDMKFCTSCGNPIGTTPAQPTESQVPTQPQPTQPQPAVQQPVYAMQPTTVYTEEPISTGGYIGIFLLMMLPIINLICIIVWACGGCNKRNKRNLSRAILVWMLISALIGGVIALAGGLLFGDSIDELMKLGEELQTLSGE